MEFLGEIEWKLFRALGFDDALVLFENLPMPGVQLLVGFLVAIVASGEPIKFGFVIRHRGAQINIGMPLDASRLAPLDRHHEGQNDGIHLFSDAVLAKFVHRRIDLVLETAIYLGEVDHRRLGPIAVAEDAGMNPWKMREICEIFDHARGVGAPLAFRRVRFPVEARVAELGRKLRNVLARFVETDPDQTVALLDAISLRTRLDGEFPIRRQRGYASATAVRGVVPTVISAN